MNRQSFYNGLGGNVTVEEVCIFNITMISFNVEEFFVELPRLVCRPLTHLALHSTSSIFDQTVVRVDLSHFCLVAVGRHSEMDVVSERCSIQNMTDVSHASLL